MTGPPPSANGKPDATVTRDRPNVTHPAYVLVTTADALPVSAVEESAVVGLDLETTGLSR
jgi:hypothetical protein